MMNHSAGVSVDGGKRHAVTVQAVILLMLLLAVQFAVAILRPLGLDEPKSIWGYYTLTVAGAALAWPGLLAVWAVFGPQRVAVRLPFTFWLALASGLATFYGLKGIVFGITQQVAWYSALATPLAFGALQAPLWLIRGMFRQRLVRHKPAPTDLDAASPRETSGAGQFSLRALFAWILTYALLLAAWRWVAADTWLRGPDAFLILRGACDFSVFFVPVGLPAVALAWIILADGRAAHRVVLSCLILAGIVGAGQFAGRMETWPEIPRKSLLAIELGVMLNAVVSVGAVRVFGFRLRRRTARTNASQRYSAPISVRRFALALTPLIAAAAALGWSVPYWLAERRRNEIEFVWHGIGLDASFTDEGMVTRLKCRHRPPLPDEVCRRIAGLTGLRALDLAGSTIDDRQLALLAPLSCLEDLDLSSTQITSEGLGELRRFPTLKRLNLKNTPISDAGLARVRSLPALASLDLSLTEITDTGLLTLQRMHGLRNLDVRLTAVSAAAAASFRESNPKCAIEFGASDDLLLDATRRTTEYVWSSSDGLASENYHFKISCIKLKRLHARGATVGRDGTVEAVTNIGPIHLLGAQAELEELDLRDSEVDDLGVGRLARLTRLRRLDLRGSKVTQEGLAELVRKLPECEVLW